ncbi:MAG TPA: hypothetical protein VMT29_08205 [Steroidobacteraceae bacterium]|nr:hypothetical protein [Steroidobacteraceae bacterium]
MAVKQVDYREMTIRAAVFEAVGTGRFIAVVSIARTGRPAKDRREKLFEPPSEDGLFDDPDEALATALTYAREIIDGNVPDLTIEDL